MDFSGLNDLFTLLGILWILSMVGVAVVVAIVGFVIYWLLRKWRG